jgi:hypothetical protein
MSTHNGHEVARRDQITNKSGSARRAFTALSLTAALAAMGACGTGWAGWDPNAKGGTTTAAPKTASVVLSHTISSSDPTAPCKGTTTWKLTPVTLSGVDGDPNPKQWQTDYNVTPDVDTDFGPLGHSCTIRLTPGDKLRTGKWQLQTTTGNYGGTCVFELHAGLNGLGYNESKENRCVAN